MDLKLRIVENPNDEYAGCIVLAAQKVIAFKIEGMHDLVKVLETDC